MTFSVSILKRSLNLSINQVRLQEPNLDVNLVLIILAQIMRNVEPQLNRPDQMRKIQHNGETYLNSFDFFQMIQRWMYQQGFFNYYGSMQG